MYRTSSHEPRYKHSTRVHKPSHGDSREYMEDTSEDEEDSTDRYSEESETSDSEESDSLRKYSEDSAVGKVPNKRGAYTIMSKPNSYVQSTYIGTSKIQKHDKVTQKNLLSPFPSFTVPPVYREVSGPPMYRVTNVKGLIENEHKHQGKPPKGAPKKNLHDLEEDSPCCLHNLRDDRRGHDKHRDSRRPRGNRSERILTCVPSVGSLPAAQPLPVRKAKTFLKTAILSPATTEPRAPKTVEQEPPTKCSEPREKHRRKTSAIGVTPSPAGDSGPIVPENEETYGKVKEKLVYVVEEKGKDVKKLETDLITLNEILAIKKDLLELSDFARKLKRLKEIAKEAESGKTQENPCHCKPATELLQDVNRRIESLEARQEELERGSKIIGPKEDEEVNPKKSVGKKPSFLQSKTALVPKPSAASTNPSFPKMEMMLSRTDGFSNNSDILNELMDIKAQLLKLEKRRMSKDMPEEPHRPEKKEDPAIAVFSSRTYILAENVDKRCEVSQERGNFPGAEALRKRAKGERMKENVSNWLKGILPSHPEDVDADAYLAVTNGTKGDGDPEMGKNLKCRNCLQVFKEEDVANQEQQKNRAPVKASKNGDGGHRKREPSAGRNAQIKECIVTRSGKIFGYVAQSTAKLSRDSPAKSQMEAMWKPEVIKTCLKDSSGSVPTVVVAKERIRRIKTLKNQEERPATSPHCKREKTARNMDLKNFAKMVAPSTRDKRHKESKNEFTKFLETHVLALTRSFGRSDTSTSTTSRSEFLASVNLEAKSRSLDSSRDAMQKAAIMTYIAEAEAVKPMRQRVEDCQQLMAREKIRKQKEKEKRKEKKRYEAECKRTLKKKRRCEEKLERAKEDLKKKIKREKIREEKKKSPCSMKDDIPEMVGAESDTCVPSIAKKNDSLEVLKKKLECIKRARMELKMQRQFPESCMLKSFMKNLSRMYSRPCRSQMYASGCSSSSKPKTNYRHYRQESSGEYSYYEDDDDDEDCSRAFCECHRSDYGRGYHQHQHSHHHQQYNVHRTQPEHVRRCRCVKVYLHNERNRGWSGMRAPKCVERSTESSVTVFTSSLTPESFYSRKSNFGVPRPLIHVAHCTKKEKSKRDCDDKKKKKKKKPHRKHHKKHHKKNKDKKKNPYCKCKKCGNVHCREMEKKCKSPEREPKEEACHPPTPKKSCCAPSKSFICESKKDGGEMLPMFNFFSNFCKSRKRPKSTKSKSKTKFTLKKMGEVHKLTTCGTVSRPPSKNIKRKSAPDVCQCPPTKELECSRDASEESEPKKKEPVKTSSSEECKKTPSEDECDSSEKSKKKKHKKKKKKKKKKKCDCGCMSNSDEKEKKKKCDCGCMSNSDEKEKKKKKKKHKKKKKKKKKKSDECLETEDEDRLPDCKNHDTAACYHTLLHYLRCDTPRNSSFRTAKTSDTSTDINEKTSMMQRLEHRLQKKRQRIKEKLSSLHSFCKNLQKLKKSAARREMEDLVLKIGRKQPPCEPRPQSDPDFFLRDDGSKSSQMPSLKELVDLGEEPKYQGKRRRKDKKQKRDKRSERPDRRRRRRHK